MIHCEDEKAVSEACSVLNNDGVIIYPTDTLYGFGCDAKKESAIQKINTIKGRISPMSVLAPNKETASSWVDIPEYNKKKVLEKLGGPTTVILPVMDSIVSNLITGEIQTLGIRIPDHEFCQKLSQEYPNPITTTSVNRTGQEPMTNPEEIISEFGNEFDLFIDDGIIGGSGSTIYIYKEGDLKILRP